MRPTHAATLTVSNLQDSGSGSLREAIVRANAAPGSGGSTIGFAPDLKGEVRLETPLPTIASAITLVGRGGLSLSGGGRVRLFALSSTGKLSLESLELKNGRDREGGGVFLNQGGTLAVQKCAFTSNRSDGGGGVLWNKGGAASFSDCTFKSNAAKTSGSVFLNAVGDGNKASALSAQACAFIGNSGPAVDNEVGCGVSLVASRLSKGLPSASGGAVVNAGRMLVAKCQLDGNTSNADGGAILNRDGALLIDSCTIAYNAARSGGAVRSSGQLRIVNSTLAFNTAQSSYGGAALSLDAKGATQVEFCTLVGNITAGATTGGAIKDTDSALSVKNTLFIANGTGAFTSALPDPSVQGDDNGNFSFPNAKAAGVGADANGFALLALNGGVTPTIALLPRSPALDVAVPLNETPRFDQRGEGFPRASGARADVGAFELQQ